MSKSVTTGHDFCHPAVNFDSDLVDKIIWKITFTLLLTLPFGCDLDGGCGDFEQQYIDITGLEARNVRLIEDGYTILEELPSESSLRYDRYGIVAIPNVNLISQNQKTDKPNRLFATAYACSPEPPQPSEIISDIAIFSNADYVQVGSSRVISAGDTLNAVFTIYDYYSGRIVGLPDFLMDKGTAASEQGFILQPSVTPAEAQQHEFTIHYRLENGEFYEATLPAVELLP